jgi:hypothetical protein
MKDYMLVNVSARVVIYALVVAALFGCKGTNATPSASPSSSSAPARNPGSTTITVENSQNKPLSLAQVTLSSSVDDSNQPTGTIYGQQITGPSYERRGVQGTLCIHADHRSSVNEGCNASEGRL